MSWTSKGRKPNTRFEASRTTWQQARSHVFAVHKTEMHLPVHDSLFDGLRLTVADSAAPSPFGVQDAVDTAALIEDVEAVQYNQNE